MVGIIVVGGMVAGGASGGVIGGIAAGATHLATRCKGVDESDHDVKVARRQEKKQEKYARIAAPFSRIAGYGLSILGGAAASGGFVLAYFEKSWVHGSFRPTTPGEVLSDNIVETISLLGVTALGIGLIVLASKLDKYGNTTVNNYLNTDSVKEARAERKRVEENLIQQQLKKDNDEYQRHIKKD